MSRAQERAKTTEKRKRFIDSINERFFSELDKEKPKEDGTVDTLKPLMAVHSWLEKMCHKYPQESSFFIGCGSKWLDMYTDTMKKYGYRKKKGKQQ